MYAGVSHCRGSGTALADSATALSCIRRCPTSAGPCCSRRGSAAASLTPPNRFTRFTPGRPRWPGLSCPNLRALARILRRQRPGTREHLAPPISFQARCGCTFDSDLLLRPAGFSFLTILMHPKKVRSPTILMSESDRNVFDPLALLETCSGEPGFTPSFFCFTVADWRGMSWMLQHR